MRRHPDVYGVPKQEDIGVDRKLQTSESSIEEPALNTPKSVTSGAYRHWLSEVASGSEKGCAPRKAPASPITVKPVRNVGVMKMAHVMPKLRLKLADVDTTFQNVQSIIQSTI